MSKKINTPVLLICFNRPNLTRKVFEQIRIVKPSKLYVAVDGPRNNTEKVLVDDVKSIFKTIDWPCRIKKNFQKKNLGCKLGPIAAMKWFFKNEEMGIILEDDILASVSFFYYCDELLNKYKNTTEIGTISGNNFTDLSNTKYSYLFTKYSQTWGWATWRRVWEKYDLSLSDWPYKKKERWLKSILDNTLARLYWKIIFNAVYKGEIESAWDYQWTYMSWKNGLLTIIPRRNLATNIGIGVAGATHTKMKGKLFDFPKFEMEFPMKHPKEHKSNILLDAKIQKSYVLWKEILMNLFRKFCIIYRKSVGRK